MSADRISSCAVQKDGTCGKIGRKAAASFHTAGSQPEKVQGVVQVKDPSLPSPNVPTNPHSAYKDGGWQGHGQCRGNGNQPNKALKESKLINII